MSEKKQFYCLRCQHRFPMDYDAKVVIERSCPKCGSNSVRLAPTPPVNDSQTAGKIQGVRRDE